MQSDKNEIYKITAERTGELAELYKNVGDFIFKALADQMRRPQSIIIKLKGLGYWYLRKSRMDAVADQRIPYKHDAELQSIFKERLKEYNKYIEIRNEIRRKRDERIKDLGFDNREDESQEASKDNLEEH